MTDDTPRRYGQWAGDTKGRAEDLTKCRKEVSSGPGLHGQCFKARGHGHSGDWCATHTPADELDAVATWWSVPVLFLRENSEPKAVPVFKIGKSRVRTAGGWVQTLTQYDSLHPTWQEARDALVSAWEARRRGAASSLQAAADALGFLADRKPPASALLLAFVLLALPSCAWFQETMSHGPLVPTTQAQEERADRWQYGRHPDLDPRLQQGKLADQR